MDVRRMLSGPSQLRNSPAEVAPNGRRTTIPSWRIRQAFATIRSIAASIARPVSDQERFFHHELVHRDVDGRPAHDMPLTTPGHLCAAFTGGIGAAHYHFGRRSSDGAALIAFNGHACPAEIREDSAAPERLRFAS